MTIGLEIEVVDVWQHDITLPNGWKWNHNEALLINSDLETCAFEGHYKGGELNSPPFIYDDEKFWQDLESLLQQVKSHGGKANFSTGIHVHIGIDPYISFDEFKKLALNSVYADPLLISMAMPGTTRRTELANMRPFSMQDYIACFSGKDNLTDVGKKYPKPMRRVKRTSINLFAFFSNGLPGKKKERTTTIEFRHFNGSLDIVEIKFLAMFCHELTALMLTTENAAMFRNDRAMLKELGIENTNFPKGDNYYMKRDRIMEIFHKCQKESGGKDGGSPEV
jgi:hypothetical protein